MGLAEGDGQVNVLFVDDQEEILKALKRQISQVSEINGFYESNPLNVAKQIELNNIDIIVADVVMPQMDGIKLLSQIKDSHPNIIRLLLTAHGDYDVSVRAINDAEVFGLITKPWKKEYLFGYLRMAAKQLVMNREIDIPTPLIIYAIWSDEEGVTNIYGFPETKEQDLMIIASRVFMTAAALFGYEYRFSNNRFSYPIQDLGISIRGKLTKNDSGKNCGIIVVKESIDDNEITTIDEVIANVENSNDLPHILKDQYSEL